MNYTSTRWSGFGLTVLGFALFLVSLPFVPMGVRSAGAGTPPTFTVNSFSDVPADFANDPNYDVCRTNVMNTTCTLRAAIMNANRYVGGGVIINIPSGSYRLTTAPSGTDDDSTGDLNITNAMTITGVSAADTVIDANQVDRVFNVESGSTVTMSDVTIRNGLGNSFGGGIINKGALILDRCMISGNQTTFGNAGGGIINFNMLTLNHTIVSGNRSGGNAGGVFNDNSAVLTVDSSVVSNNQTLNGGFGGGIGNAGAITLNNSIVSDNHATGSGGAIANFSGTLTETSGTINHNSAIGDGGAIYNSGAAVLTNCTISANGAHGNGGAIFQFGTVRLFHVTVAGNVADTDVEGAGGGGGIFRAAGGSANEIWSSSFVENYAGSAPNDCGGDPVTSQDYNYIQTIGTGASCTITGTTTHNIIGGDALLDVLQDNGGPTPTRALFAGSPAIDQIPPALCRDAFGTAPFPDQRGVPRPVGPSCDIGAFEGAAQMAVFGRNLVRNGDAENGAGSLSGAFVGVPSWQSGGGQLLTVVPYDATGGFPSATANTTPVIHGRNFFAGGVSAVAVGTQVVDLSPFAGSIDAGTSAFDFSADLGGFDSQDDNATVEADFLDGTSHLLTLSKLGPVTAADRNNVTGFLHRDVTGLVPAQTRTIELFVTLTGVTGPYNDGYADNLSLVLTSTVPVCPGDCHGQRVVTISDLVRAVNIALGSSPLSDCRSADQNNDGIVSINELIAAVNAALNGCP